MEKRSRVRWCLAVGGSAVAVSLIACSGQVEGVTPTEDASVDRNVPPKPPPTTTTTQKPKPPDPPDPPVDSGVDAAKDSSTTTKDASAFDSGWWNDDAGTCKASNVAFVPPDIHPPAPSQAAACTQVQIDALADACAKDPASAGCGVARAAYAQCSDCLFGNKTDANWKMIVLDSGAVLPTRYNQPGCIELASGVKDCGKKYFTVVSCFDAYCSDCSGAQETACQKDVAQGSGECKQYLIDQACGNALDAVEKTCFPGENTDAAMKTLFINMATLFCRKSAPLGGG